MEKKLFYLLILSAFICSCNDKITYTGYVWGTVKAASGDSTLTGVTVECGGKSYTTSSNGAYTLEDIPTGNTTITATKAKYNTYTNTVDIKTEGTREDISLVLINPVK
jgi:hypothetical protein